MIPVTKPFLPPIEEYHSYVGGIFKRNWLTNNGPLVNELELKLKEYLNLPHILYLSNGTIALQIAIRALELKGEIITTPFSYVATTSSIVWEGCKPIFVDIDPNSFNIDPSKIEEAITPQTCAILATHVFGNPCDIDAIQAIATAHNLKVIYDAAHCFGTSYKDKSIFSFGDISTTSFHSTKLFHTIEGGAVFAKDPELIKKMSLLRNFGHNGPDDFSSVGINGKNSEFHAAMGVINLKYITKILESRKVQSAKYDLSLIGVDHQKIAITPNSTFNHAYYPILLPSQSILLKIQETLNADKIFPRRYFYPSLNGLNYVEYRPNPISESISTRILCLPLYFDLTVEEIEFVCRLIKRAQNN